MIFTITQAGLLAANNAQSGGPKINITSFKVGSAVNYSPTISDVALRGTVLYTQAINGYAVLSANEVEYTLILDDSVGDFSFGEVGLFMEDGTLFALSSLTEIQAKKKTNASDAGNIVSFEARLVITQIAAVITFPINQMPNARLLEVPSVDLLKPPSVADSNAYLTLSKDTAGSSIPAYRAGDFEWSFPSFTKVFSGVVTGNGVGYTAANITLVGGTTGTVATAQATVANGAVNAITRNTWGSGYTTPPVVAISGDGLGAEATATITQGVVSASVANQGSGYVSPPAVVISGGGGTGATATAQLTGDKVTGITITNPGRGYTGTPNVTLTGGSGIGATAAATVSGVVDTIRVSANSVSSLIAAALTNAAAAVVPGKYIVQLLSGNGAGYCRNVTSSSNSSLSWATSSPLGSQPNVGDQFVLYQSINSILDDLKTQLSSGNGALPPCRIVIESNVPLAGLGTWDGRTITAGQRVLCVGQTNGNENGPYLASSGAWTRTADFNSSGKANPGCLIPIAEGAQWADSVWQLATDLPIVLGTTALKFQPANQKWVKKIANSISLVNVLALS